MKIDKKTIAIEYTLNDPMYRGARSWILLRPIGPKSKYLVTKMGKGDDGMIEIHDAEVPYLPSFKVLTNNQADALKGLYEFGKSGVNRDKLLSKKRSALEKKLEE